MKTIFAATAAIAMLAAGIASAAPYHNRHHRGHQVCSVRHHHRVCHWVR
jgi:hypothetical protein